VRELRAQGQSIRQIEAELQGQLHLFRGAERTRVSRLLTPFEEALLLHEQGRCKSGRVVSEAINDGDNVARPLQISALSISSWASVAKRWTILP